jgi:hypothetical protein
VSESALSLSVRAEALRRDVRRVLSGSAAIFLPAEVKLLFQEQTDILSGLAEVAKELKNGTPPADLGGTLERK